MSQNDQDSFARSTCYRSRKAPDFPYCKNPCMQQSIQTIKAYLKIKPPLQYSETQNISRPIQKRKEKPTSNRGGGIKETAYNLGAAKTGPPKIGII